MLLTSSLSVGLEDGSLLCPESVMAQVAEALAAAACTVDTDVQFTVDSVREMSISGCDTAYTPTGAAPAPAADTTPVADSTLVGVAGGGVSPLRRLLRSDVDQPRRLTSTVDITFSLLAASQDAASGFLAMEVPATFATQFNSSFYGLDPGILISQCSGSVFVQGCNVAAVANSLAVPCQEGSMLGNGSTCTLQCAAGYSPSSPTLICNSGTIGAFTCSQAQCTAPAHPQTDSINPSCQIGETILDGEVCIPWCPEGQASDVPSLTCDAGTLTPANFTCIAPNCAAPNVSYAESPSCLGMATLTPGATCTPACTPGYHASIASIQCGTAGGRFVNDATFTCVPDVTTPAPFMHAFAMTDTESSSAELPLEALNRCVFGAWAVGLVATGVGAFITFRGAASAAAQVAPGAH